MLTLAILISCVILPFSTGTPISDGYILQQFDFDLNLPLLHLILNNQDNFVYISGVNRIYQMNKDLQEDSLIQVNTGPVNDSRQCLPFGEACEAKVLKLTDNYNKLFLMDIDRGKLLICGSIYQGICEARSLQNISNVRFQHENEDKQYEFTDKDYISCVDRNCTTVGVIAEGPTVFNPVLYVANTFVKTTNKNTYGTLSTRSLHVDPARENKLFLYAVDDGINRFSRSPAENVKKTYEDSKQYFKYGFSTDGEDGFIYFLFQKLEGKVMKTMISRTCKKDEFYMSYVEMPLACGSGGEVEELVGGFYQKTIGFTDFPLENAKDGVLYVAFKSASRSSLCAYMIQDLNAKFDETVVSCYKYEGKDSKDGSTTIAITNMARLKCLAWMNPDKTLEDPITRVLNVPQLDYYQGYHIGEGKIRCGAFYLPSLLERIPEVGGTWSYHHLGVMFSAITVNLVDNKFNVAFIGTEEGQIIQLDINHKNVYSTLDIGYSVLSDLVLDEDSTLLVPHLYVLTNSKVFHIKVSACERHATCSDCLGAKDPYCGWCILKSSCMPRTSECSSVGLLEPLSTQCIEASAPEPMERSMGRDITIKVKLMPVLQTSKARYSCIYNGTVATDARVDPNDSENIICRAPHRDDLPEDFDGKGYVNVSISIRYNDEVDIISTTATFYDCKAHGSTLNLHQPCQSCLLNKWKGKCQWCIDSHTCSPIERGTCTSQPELCPKVISVSDESKLLPVGLPTEITLNVASIPQTNANYTCLVDLEGSRLVPAVLSESGEKITCQKQTYTYSKKAAEIPANVTLFWKEKYNVDVQAFDHLTFYNCSVKFDDCSLCVTSKSEYKCGWCGSKCTTRQTCHSDWVTDAGSCPAPEIQSFSPASGPIAGNTLLTINGKNMGVSVDDVGSVTVAGVPCTVERDMYLVSKQVVCRTGPTKGELDGKVSVTVRNVTKISEDSFYYRNPTLLEVVPREGPKAGGTMVAIKGKNLDTGFLKEAYIESKPCTVQIPLRNSSVLECKTSPSDELLKNVNVSVSFDGFTVSVETAFSYVENPVILSYTTASEKLSSFLAGGRDIVITGKRFNIVQDARIVAIAEKRLINQLLPAKRRRKRDLGPMGIRSRRAVSDYVRYSADCSIINSTVMICPTPEIDSTIKGNTTLKAATIKPLAVPLLLKLDNINEKLNGTMKYYPNPILISPGPDQTKDATSGATSVLKIKVLNLNKDAIMEHEIIIMIGEERCPVVSIDFDKGKIPCKIPPKPEGERTNFPITVQMGNSRYDLGELTYFVAPLALTQTIMIVLIIATVAVLCTVGFLIFCCLRRNKHYKKNENNFPKAIENLELSVRADCQKAFAELSIDMNALATDISDVGLPILNYRQYAMNMFFQEMRLRPCMKEPDQSVTPIPAVEQAFVEFNLLLTDKHFLLSFIHTLEQQLGFSSRDKRNVASFLTVVLHKKLDYFTEVMKLLISELVESSKKRNPKVVFQRTESVAERMLSNWMAICLYPFIREKAGKPLYLLQKAIKHQVSKGALDAVTGKARFTLSDDRLLKEDIQSELLTLHVPQTDNDEPVIVKVLSCDTISQVKEKVMDAVYKRIPFSLRPKAEQFDLEWRRGRSGHLVLPQLNYANEPGSRWRRVMTIKDYKVENNATMALIRRDRPNDVVDQYTNQSPHTSVTSPMLPEDNTNVYHLVKCTDDLEEKKESTVPRARNKLKLDLYLVRLINMKGVLQSYVDDAFRAILDASSIPPAVQHFFDFLDELAITHEIDDPETLHLWKTNSVLGGFWVTILNNPEFVFDIDKPKSVESSMTVISQAFIDACSVQEHKPTQDSPIYQQLYAKELPTYKKMVQKYYSDAYIMPSVSGQDISVIMTEEVMSYNVEFDVHVAYNELWGYVNKYYEEIQQGLSDDPNTTQAVIQRLEQTYKLIDSSVNNP